MLPGLDGTGIMFGPLVGELAGAVDPVVVSYPQDRTGTYRALTDRLSDALPEDDFFILGESFSGPIALMLADGKPEKLRGVILCASFISNPSALFPSSLRFLIGAPLFSLWPLSLKAAVLTGGRGTEEIRNLIIETGKSARNEALAARTRETLTVNVSGELRRCGYPILYLRGRRDLVVGSRNLRKIQSIRKDVSDVTLEASHLVLQEAPRESARAILEFMKRHM